MILSHRPFVTSLQNLVRSIGSLQRIQLGTRTELRRTYSSQLTISLNSSLLSHGPYIGTSLVARLCGRDLLDHSFTHTVSHATSDHSVPVEMILSFGTWLAA